MATSKKAEVNAGGKKTVADREFLATEALRPSLNAAAVVAAYGNAVGLEDGDLGVLMKRLADETKDAWAGDTKRAEAMLFGQAHALQAIFMNLARRAQRQEYLKQWEAYLRMALRAQNQCRMTLETLATIKNPPVVFARQANIAHGPQQVNNGAQPAPPAQGEGGVESLPAPSPGTALDPTRRVFSAGGEIQTVGGGGRSGS